VDKQVELILIHS